MNGNSLIAGFIIDGAVMCERNIWTCVCNREEVLVLNPAFMWDPIPLAIRRRSS